MKKALLATVAAAALGFGGAAYATPIYIDNGVNHGPDNSTKTSAFNTLGVTETSATSIYLGVPQTIGTTVYDTNSVSVMQSYGFTAGLKDSLGTAQLTAVYPQIPAGVNVDLLNTPTTGNGFTNGTGDFGWGNGYWGLTYEYTLTGVTTATGVYFSGGTIDIFYHDAAPNISGLTNPDAAALASNTNKTKVLEIDVTGSSLKAPNLTVFGKVDAAFLASASSFVQNFWHIAGGAGTSFAEYFNAGGSGIDFKLDVNVNPADPTADHFWTQNYRLVEDGPIQTAFFRQATTSGTIEFTVPEPATLALMGLALAGAGVVSRRRKQA